jgi:hypothetical protein
VKKLLLDGFRPYKHFIFLFLTLCFILPFTLQPNQDTYAYQCYAKAFLFGGNSLQTPASNWCYLFVDHPSALPFHTLPAEYPLLAILLFSAPLLFPFLPYDLTFMVLISGVIIRLYFYFCSRRSQTAGVVFLCCIILCSSLIGGRYDLIPAGLVLLSLVAAEKRFFSAAYTYLALATLLKLYPLLLLVPLMIAEQKTFKPQTSLYQRFLKPGLFALTLLGSLVVGYLLSAQETFGFLQYMLQRPVQIESVPASLLWLTSFTHSFSFCVTYQYGSLGLQETLSASCQPTTSSSFFVLIPLLASLAFLVASSFVLIAQYQNRFSLLQTWIALLLILLCTSKVLSPQYFIWLIPLLVWDKKATPFQISLWLMLLFLTALIHPWSYHLLQGSVDSPQHAIWETLFFLIVLLRNTFLVATVGYWLTTARAPK